MTAASALQVTRVTSSPRSPYESGPAQQKNKDWWTSCNVTKSDDGDQWKDRINCWNQDMTRDGHRQEKEGNDRG